MRENEPIAGKSLARQDATSGETPLRVQKNHWRIAASLRREESLFNDRPGS